MYVYFRDLGGSDNWGEVTVLTAEFPNEDHSFGDSVAIQDQGSEIIAVVGEPFGDSSVNGSGAAYIFRNAGDPDDPDDWDLVTEINADSPSVNERFGDSVAIDGDFVIVGAPFAVTGGEGSVYIFHRDSSGDWSQVASLSDETGGSFGLSVAVLDRASGDDFAFVGHPFKTVTVANEGVVHILRRIGGDPDDWDFDVQLVSPTPESQGIRSASAATVRSSAHRGIGARSTSTTPEPAFCTSWIATRTTGCT